MIHALVIDDDPDLRAVASVALVLDRDFAVQTAATVGEALSLLNENCWRFDAILLGTSTSDMDGALVEAIRQRPDCETTPVIFLTRRIGGEDRSRYRAMGAAGVLSLPFDPVAFPRQVAALIETVPH